MAVRRPTGERGPLRRLAQILAGPESLIIAGLIATGLAVAFREPLTRKSLVLTPADEESRFYSYSYDDSSSGGHSKVKRLSPLNWICTLADGPRSYCGFGLQLDLGGDGKGLDLSSYDGAEFDVDYEGTAEYLRLTIKNFQGGKRVEGQIPNDKINQATLPLTGGKQTIRLNLSDFVVAQWWKEFSKASGAAAKPSFNNVTALEVSLGDDTLRGDHHVQIKQVRLNRTTISAQEWFAGIAICWIVLLALFLTRREQHLKNWKRELANRTLNSVPQVVFSIGPDGWPDFVSQQWREHYGGDPHDLLGRGWLKLVHPEDRGNALRSWVKAYSAGERFDAEYRIRIPNGSYRWAVACARPDFDTDGKIRRWFGTWTDSNERVLAEQALKASERLHRNILEASADCICVLSTEGAVELMNGPGVAAFELPSFAAIQGKHWSTVWEGEASAVVGDAIGRAGKGEIVRFRSFCPTAKGTPKWWDVALTPMPDDDGAVKGLLAIARDITSDRQKSEQLQWASEHDALTSLPNRRAFQTRLQSATLRAMEMGHQVGLLLIDLDHFKHVNDSLGHAAGDEVLEAVSRRLRESVRENDFVARVGGDEFAIILERVQTKENLHALGQKVFEKVQAPLRLGGRVLSAGASIGGAVFPVDAESANDLFKTADTALYALKASGRGGTMLFDRYMLDEAEKVASQLGLARDAVTETSVVPVYQPKVNLQSNAVVGFEALLRWNHPTKGLQLPETVEEAFKDYELAAKIGELMQRAVASDLRNWAEAGIEFGRVSINAAPAEFLRGDYAERLLGVLAEHGVDPSKVEVEVTEHALMKQGPEYVAAALATLKAAGVQVSLDDFGTGYSSLSHLRDFPVDLVKIDKSFVQQMNEDSEIASIVAAVVNLARSIEIEVVAEGVETPAQLELLRAMGCQLAQGHLFGKPVEKAEVASLLGTKRAAA
jgi:diguanylate cyclase (GGDEF)-like protein/PAS domain S-box-containing protein